MRPVSAGVSCRWNTCVYSRVLWDIIRLQFFCFSVQWTILFMGPDLNRVSLTVKKIQSESLNELIICLLLKAIKMITALFVKETIFLSIDYP